MILFLLKTLAGGLTVNAVFLACLGAMFLARSYLPPLQSPGVLYEVYVWATLPLYAFMALSPIIWLLNGALSAVVIIESLLAYPASWGAGNPAARRRVFRFWHCAAAAHTAVVLLTAEVIVRSIAILADLLALLVWTALGASLLALALASRREPETRFTWLGALTAALAFGGALFYIPSLYGWDFRPLGWYPLLAAGIPFLVFLGILLRRIPPFAGSARRRRGAVAALFLIMAAAIALRAAVAPPPSGEFSAALAAVLDTGADEICVAEITDFEWDTLEIYAADTDKRDLSRPAHKGFDLYTQSTLASSESYRYVVFSSDGKAAHYELLPFRVAHFADRRNLIRVQRREAKFAVAYDTPSPTLRLLPAR